jgi:hypothetical protein
VHCDMFHSIICKWHEDSIQFFILPLGQITDIGNVIYL